jgi:hypothetical protein
MKYGAILLALIFVGGIAGSYYFWPSDRGQEANAFFSVLQFLAAFGLIFLTSLYVKTAREQLADQNRPPK